MTGISKSQVSPLCAEIDDKIGAFLDRPLEGDWPHCGSTRPICEGPPERAHRVGGSDRRRRRQQRWPARGAGFDGRRDFGDRDRLRAILSRWTILAARSHELYSSHFRLSTFAPWQLPP